MSKFFSTILSFFFIFLFLIVLPFYNYAFAASCSSAGIKVSSDPAEPKAPVSSIKLNLDNIDPNSQYQLKVSRSCFGPGLPCFDFITNSSSDNQGHASFTINEKDVLHPNTYTGYLFKNDHQICDVSYKIFEHDYTTPPSCKLTYGPSAPTSKETIRVNVENINPGNYFLHLDNKTLAGATVDSSKKGTFVVGPFPDIELGRTYILGMSANFGESTSFLCSTNVSFKSGGSSTPRPVPGEASILNGGGCTLGQCSAAAGQTCNGDRGILTALGCVPTDPGGLINGMLKMVTGAAGGIALMLMVFGSIQMMTSAGNPDQLKAGRERFFSAAIGLLFIIFSILLLQIVGVDILQLPGFSK